MHYQSSHQILLHIIQKLKKCDLKKKELINELKSRNLPLNRYIKELKKRCKNATLLILTNREYLTKVVG